MAGRYDEAVALYQGLQDKPAIRTLAAIGLAACYRETGKYTEALTELDAVADAASKSAPWHTAKAEIVALEGRYQEAINLCRNALQLDPAEYRARTLLGRLLEITGKRVEAIETYQVFEEVLVVKVPDKPESITAVGEGFQRYCELIALDRAEYVLQELFQVAYGRVDRSYWPARLAAANLLRNKYKLEDAADDYQAALGINPLSADAHVGIATIALEGWNFDAVEHHVAEALKINPRSVAAINVRSGLKLALRRYDEGLSAVREALAINPNDLHALSLGAALAVCKRDAEEEGRFRKRVDEINPRCDVLHRTVADALSGLRQFEASEKEYQRAIDYEPNDPHARAELGLMYMQWGKEDEARLALEEAWRIDEYNDRTKNTLELLETLAGYPRHESEHFTIVYDPNDAILGRYFAEYLESIYTELCEDYDIQLVDKTIIQIFPTHRLFGVRITGKPWIHTVGACTGRVIAMDSPRPSPHTMGPYHYANVLRHEFTHTVTLAATGNRIAHWFTEGLAVLQEDSPRRYGWCRLLSEAIRRQRLFTLTSIDWGFMRPEQPTDRDLAYAQSEWMCEYLVERFGYDILNKMIAGFRDGLNQREVFERIVGLPQETFDADFPEWARLQAEPWGFDLSPPEDAVALREQAAAEPENADVLGRLAKAEAEEGGYDRALVAARKALTLDENHIPALIGYAESWEAFGLREKDEKARHAMEDEALPHLNRLTEKVPTNGTAPRLLGQIHLRRESWDEANKWFVELQRRSPLDPAGYRGLAGIYLKQKKDDEALVQLRTLARMEDNDPDVPARLGDIYARTNRLSDARHGYLQAVYINPFEPSYHERLAEVCMRSDDTPAALEEYLTLCQLEPQNARYLSQAALAYHKLGKSAEASEYARRAVAIDPNAPAAPLTQP